MKQRFYVVIESKKEIDPKDVLFALREARPNWGNMSASLAAQQSAQRTDCPHAETFVEDGFVCCAACGERLHEAISR